jgi:hypothetical protein
MNVEVSTRWVKGGSFDYVLVIPGWPIMNIGAQKIGLDGRPIPWWSVWSAEKTFASNNEAITFASQQGWTVTNPNAYA